jgi:hypothetical protein
VLEAHHTNRKWHDECGVSLLATNTYRVVHDLTSVKQAKKCPILGAVRW